MTVCSMWIVSSEVVRYIQYNFHDDFQVLMKNESRLSGRRLS
jgi:hypothetical protein